MTPPDATAPARIVLSTTTEGATIRYTIDGAWPDATSPVYTNPILIDQPRILRARAFKTMWAPSDLAEVFYDIAPGEVLTPQLAPAPGRFTTAQEVVITCDTPDAVIRLTTNGLDPTESDPAIDSGTVLLVDRSMVVKVKAWKDGVGESGVQSGTYLITGMVAAGANFTLALKSDGSVWAWGANGDGQLGNGGTAPSVATPVPVLLPVPAVAVAGGGSHSLAVDRTGAVWAWGANNVGQLGNGTTVSSATPVMVEGLSQIVAIAAGGSHNLALARNGTVWAWGSNGRGRLGDGTTTNRPSPVRVLDIDRLGVVGIAARNAHSLAWTRTGSAFAWGVNFNGQLGRPPDVDDHPRPTSVPAPALHALAAGTFHTLGLETGGAAAGRLWYWGSPPAVYPDPDDVTMPASGDSNLLVKADGSVWTSRGAPLAILDLAVGPENVVGVSAGQSHFVAVSSDGTIWAWGSNAFGQLGDGTLDAKVDPAPVLGLRLVENVAAGEDPDSDWLSDAEEYRLGTDPRDPDTNDDGILDGLAVALGLSPTHPDMDADGVGNALEIAQGTDPFRADSDGDGISDGADCFPLDSTQNQCLVDVPGDDTPPGITILVPRGLRFLSSSP
jgi:alpha-tubulin suppressor-like RCC1 family protein